MATYFYDTSAIVKRYFAETGSQRVDNMIADSTIIHAISRLTLAEVSAAIIRRLQTAAAVELVARFDNDASVVFGYVIVDDAMFDESVVLVRRHRLRGCDSLQLASALRLAQAIGADDDFTFVCADDELNQAAQAEGLTVENPNTTKL